MRQACVFGASGGIGQALTQALVEGGQYDCVWAGSRSGMAIAGAAPFSFDLTDEASIAQACARIGAQGRVHLAIIATGMLHDGELRPEKSWRALDAAAMARVYAVNTIGPALIAKHMLPLLAPSGPAVFAALSARVGSIEDNRLGGWHSYRASKAALNMLIANFAIELARNRPGAIAVGLHPGTVASELSAPFQRGVAGDRLFTPAISAAHLLRVIGALTPADSGRLIAWDGSAIPF